MVAAELIPCPSCHRMVASADSECSHCGWRFHATPQATVRPAPRPKIPVCVEFAQTVDRTGSSHAFATGILKASEKILRLIERQAQSIRVWLQTHGDEECGQLPVLLTDGGAVQNALADINSIIFEGGGDAEEHHLDAVEKLLQTVPWSDDPRRTRGVMTAFVTADSKPARSGRTPEAIGATIRDRGILFYVVGEDMTRMRALCDAAGGLFFEISNDPRPEDLERIAADVAASVVATMSCGKTIPIAAPQ